MFLTFSAEFKKYFKMTPSECMKKCKSAELKYTRLV